MRQTYALLYNKDRNDTVTLTATQPSRDPNLTFHLRDHVHVTHAEKRPLCREFLTLASCCSED